MKEKKFEQAITELESIVDIMETGELSLDESLQKYEEGIKLANFCKSKLEFAEKKIEIIRKKADGSTTIEDFDKEETEGEVSEVLQEKNKVLTDKAIPVSVNVVNAEDTLKEDITESDTNNEKVNAVHREQDRFEKLEKINEDYDEESEDSDDEDQPESPTLRDSGAEEDEKLLF